LTCYWTFAGTRAVTASNYKMAGFYRMANKLNQCCSLPSRKCTAMSSLYIEVRLYNCQLMTRQRHNTNCTIQPSTVSTNHTCTCKNGKTRYIVRCQWSNALTSYPSLIFSDRKCPINFVTSRFLTASPSSMVAMYTKQGTNQSALHIQ